MHKNSKASKESKLIIYLSNLYEMYEAFSIDSVLVRCIDIFYTFLQMIGFVYYFGLEMEPGVGRYYVSLIYYSDPFILSHVLKFKSLAILLFFVFLIINIMVASSFVFRIFSSNKNHFGSYRRLNIFQGLTSCLSEIYLSCIIVESIEVFLIGFRSDEEIEYIYEDLSENMHLFLKIFGAAGIILSCLLGIPFIFFNQDYKFLNPSKVRLQVNIKLILSFLARIIENIFFSLFTDEWIHFGLDFFFLLILGINYLETFPFRNKTISVFYAFNVIYFLLNILIFSLFRLDVIIKPDDLVPMNVLFLLFSIILASKLYDFFYWKNLISEDKKKKISIFALEEIVLLYSSFKKQLEVNFLLEGYFRFHKKHGFNLNCLTKNTGLPNAQDNKSRKEYIMEFIFSSFKELIDDNKTQKIDKQSFEVIIAKYLSFFIDYGFNPIRNFFEVQKILNQKKGVDYSLYFKIFTYSLIKDLKKNAKIFLKEKKFDVADIKQKNTYDQFFKMIKKKRRLEKDFRKLLMQKISFFEKMSNGLQSLEELFLVNMKFAPMFFKFKNTLENLKNNLHFENLLKLKFSYFLNILILNHFSEGILEDKNITEYFKAKTDDLIDKEFMLDFFKESAVVFEVSFLLDLNGKIQEKCKSQRFLNFFGYSKDDGQKVNFLSNIIPQFLRTVHQKYVKNFLEQKTKAKISEITTHAIDKNGFVFPIKVSFALRYNYLDDFVLVGALMKQKEDIERFCLLDQEGNILNISSRFFFDFKNNYETLSIEDINYINIFDLINDSKELFRNNDPYHDQEGASFLNFPKKMQQYIEKRKLKERETQDFSNYQVRIATKSRKSSKSKNTQQTDASISFVRDKQPWKKAEIIFNWSHKRFGHDEDQINFIILNIIKFKQLDLVESTIDMNQKEVSNPENIPSSLFDSKIENPKFINILAPDSKINNHFGNLKVIHQNAPKTHDRLVHKEIKNIFQEESYLTSENFSSKIKNSDLRIISHVQSSTPSEYNSELRVFSEIKNIQKISPKPIKNSLMLILTQILILIIYALLYYFIIKNYIDNYFKPTQKNHFSFCQQYHFIGLVLSSNNKIEYIYSNIMDSNERPEYRTYLRKIYNTSVRIIKIFNDLKRNSIEDSQFEKDYKETVLKYVDPYSMKIREVPYIEFVDMMLTNTNDIIVPIFNFDFNSITVNYDHLIFLCRNFPKYFSNSLQIYKNLRDEYLTSNDILNEKIFTILITFLIIYLFIKILEIYNWIQFISLLQNLFIIFLRVSEDDAIKELDNLKNFLKSMKESDSDAYFHMNVFNLAKSEKIKNSSNNFGLKAKRKRKNIFFARFKGFMKPSILIYLTICFGISSLFFSINYFNSSRIINFLGKVIKINDVFSNTYIYSSSSIYLEEMLLREKIILNPNYENLNDTLQTKNGRLNFFSVSLEETMKIIGNSSSNMIIDSFETSESLFDMNLILSGNLCEILQKENEEKELCEKLLNGALKNGIGNAINEFIKNIKSREGNLQYLTKNLNEELMQKNAITDYVRSLEYFEIYLANLYLHDIWERLYNLNNFFYSDLLDKNQVNFFIFLCVSLVCFIIFNFAIIFILKIKIKKIYTFSCLVLSLIPYERLTKDEQILTFLKNFLNKHQ